MRKIISLFIILSSFPISAITQENNSTDNILYTLKKVADWQINELSTKKWKYPATEWTNGALYTGMMSWAKISNNEKYLNFLKSIGDSLQWKGGPEPFFADDYCVGQTWAEMFMIYKDSVMIKPMMQIGDSIINRPHTESLEWNFEGGLHNREWAWCDALYMGPPMLAYLSKSTGQKKYLDIINAIQNVDKLHPFPIARKIMSNVLYAYEIKDTGSIKHWTKIAFEQENKFQIEWKSRSIFPFYHYLMVDCFNLIGDYATSMKFVKIAELDYKSYNDGTIENGYYESFDLMKAICLYHIGEKNDAKRILNRTDSSALQFTFHEYHLIHRLRLEIKMCSNANSVKKQKLQKALADLIIKTGFTKLSL